MNRRDFLASMGAMPLLPGLFSETPLRPGLGARSLILIYLDGGVTHIDTFDGKPEAPPDIRGDLRSVKCSLDGVFISDHLPRLGKVMDRCVLLRSITHGEGNHDRGTHYLLTGHKPSPVLVYPAIGSLLALRSPAHGTPLPSYVCVPTVPNYGGPGFLPLTLGPFETGGDPKQASFKVRDLSPKPDMDRALDLLGKVDALDGGPRSATERARDDLLGRARALSLDPEARRVFELRSEPEATAKRYGRHQFGQSCLLARRLVGGGARAVLVRYRGWDHHVNVNRALTFGYPPKLTALDEGLSALIEDLERKGLCEKVLVALVSEFGRTPRINPAGGRDHWPRAQSVLLYGAGLKRGLVIGKTDPRGEEPIEQPLSPADVHATILAALGLDLKRGLVTKTGRPIPLVENGAGPINEVLSS